MTEADLQYGYGGVDISEPLMEIGEVGNRRKTVSRFKYEMCLKRVYPTIKIAFSISRYYSLLPKSHFSELRLAEKSIVAMIMKRCSF